MTGRFFSGSQRVRMAVRAQGRCEWCDDALEPGWHADHKKPFVLGGETTVENGQALCPRCNLKKGSWYMEPRKWQQEALTMLVSSRKDFLTEATPGAGKTTHAMLAYEAIREIEGIERLIVVAPSTHLRRQWAIAATAFGVDLHDTFSNGDAVLAPDYHGVTVTYQGVAAAPELWRMLSTQVPTLVVFDEIHHADDEDGSWGPALREAFGNVARRLLLTGTAFRTNRSPIPWVEYNEAGFSIPSFKYGYTKALRDGVVRPIQVVALDGDTQWRQAQAVTKVSLAEASDQDLSKALNSALQPDGDWIDSVLRRADEDLTRERERVRDAAGLVIAYDQSAAKRIARRLERICGETPTLAISEDAESSRHIDTFRRGRSRWIVAVQMVSEGVDIPRLAVGVWASKYRTELFFRQVVGRFVRMRGEEDSTVATLYIPSVQPLIRFGANLNHEADAALRQSSQDLIEDIHGVVPMEERMTADIVVPLPASAARHHTTIYGDHQFGEDELLDAKQLRLELGVHTMTDAQMAQLTRALGERIGGPQIRKIGTLEVPKPRDVTLSEQKKAARRKLGQLVNSYVHRSEGNYAEVWPRLNSEVDGVQIEQATLDNVERRMEIVLRWLRELDL